MSLQPKHLEDEEHRNKWLFISDGEPTLTVYKENEREAIFINHKIVVTDPEHITFQET